MTKLNKVPDFEREKLPKHPPEKNTSWAGRVIEFFHKIGEKWSSSHRLKDLASSVSEFTSKVFFQVPLKSNRQAEKPEGKIPLAGRVTASPPTAKKQDPFQKSEEEGVEMGVIDPSALKVSAEKTGLSKKEEKVNYTVQEVMDFLHPEGKCEKSSDISMPKATQEGAFTNVRQIHSNGGGQLEDIILPDGLFASLSKEEEEKLDSLKQEFNVIQQKLEQNAKEQIKLPILEQTRIDVIIRSKGKEITQDEKDSGITLERLEKLEALKGEVIQLRAREAEIKNQIWGVDNREALEGLRVELSTIKNKMESVEEKLKALPNLSADELRAFDEQIQEIKDSSKGNKERKIARVEAQFLMSIEQVEQIKSLKEEASLLSKEIIKINESLIKGIETVDGEDPDVEEV